LKATQAAQQLDIERKAQESTEQQQEIEKKARVAAEQQLQQERDRIASSEAELKQLHAALDSAEEQLKSMREQVGKAQQYGGLNFNSPDDLASMKVLEALLNPEQIRRIQTKLTQMGLYEGPIDSVIGTLTRQAIKSFQKIIGKPDTGYLSLDQVRLLTTAGPELQSTSPAN
jgi:hypothetical protein